MPEWNFQNGHIHYMGLYMPDYRAKWATPGGFCGYKFDLSNSLILHIRISWTWVLHFCSCDMVQNDQFNLMIQTHFGRSPLYAKHYARAKEEVQSRRKPAIQFMSLRSTLSVKESVLQIGNYRRLDKALDKNLYKGK